MKEARKERARAVVPSHEVRGEAPSLASLKGVLNTREFFSANQCINIEECFIHVHLLETGKLSARDFKTAPRGQARRGREQSKE